MAKILCVTTGLTGMLHASFEVVSRLQKAGHEVTYACPWDVEEKVSQHGFDYVQLTPVNFDPVPAQPDLHGSMAGLRRMGSRLLNVRKRRKEAVEALGMAHFAMVLDDVCPDLVLIDLELHDFILTAKSTAAATVLLSPFFSTWERPSLPPINQKTIPGKGRQGHRLAIKLAWLLVHLKSNLIEWKQQIFTVFTDRISILRTYAEQVDFPANELVGGYRFPSPLAYRTLPVISLTAWELEFPHRPRPNLFYVGPMVHLDRQDIAPDSETINQLRSLYAAKQAKASKLIYCSVSTMRTGDEGFIHRVVEAVADHPEWILVIGLGGLLEKDFLENLPQNVHPFAWAPQLQILEHADLSINHGGIHTINECIHFGVPMLIYSGKRYDQNGNAARVAFHGVGIMADKDVDDVQMIRSRIEMLLSDSTFKDRIGEIRSELDRKQDELVSVIDSLLPVQP